MASALKIEVSENVGGFIGALVATGDTGLIQQMRLGIGAAVADEFRTHFEKLESERSGKVQGVATGGTGTHFWMQVRDSVHDARVVGDDVVIGIAHVGFRQRLQGGTITAGKNINPKTGKPYEFLPIAVDVDSIGKSPHDFPEGALKYVVGPGGPCLILVDHTDRIATKGKNKGKSVRATGAQEATHGAGSVMFVLRHSVTQQPDPSVIPSEAEIVKTALDAGDAAAELFLSRRDNP